MKMKKLAAFAASLAVIASSSSAGLLAHYGMENTLTADSVAGDVTASDLGTSVGGFSTFRPMEGTRSRYILNSQLRNDTDVAVADILSTIVLTPDSGQQITLDAVDSITMQIRSFSGAAGGHIFNTRIYVASDAAFTSILATSSLFTATDPGSDGNVIGDIVGVNLDSAITSSGPLYIGLAFTDNSTSGNKNGRYDDISINGTVSVIPEPATLGLVALFGGGILVIRRRLAL